MKTAEQILFMLEAHVMPISALIAGEYDSVAAQPARGPRGARRRPPRWLRWLLPSRRGEGLLYVEWLLRELQERGVRAQRWIESGSSRLSLPLPVQALHALRDTVPSASLSPHSFRHLLDHSDFQGFYLPIRFADPLWIPDPRWADHPWFQDRPELQKTSVGSVPELLEELAELQPHAQGGARTAWTALDRLARLSAQTGVPICLDG
jgi:hypothetical protein